MEEGDPVRYLQTSGVIIMARKKKTVNVDDIWDSISKPVVNNLKISILKRFVNQVLHHYNPKIMYLVNRYSKHLPNYVATSEVEDLSTLAKLEFIETLKVWNPDVNDNIWPLARRRIEGAMKDHIRYITRTDPSKFYDWVADAAYFFMAVNDRADFEHGIETGVELNEAMNCLTPREQRIVIAHTKEDLTFKEIGGQFSISESQISRIYKKSIEKIKKYLEKKNKV